MEHRRVPAERARSPNWPPDTQEERPQAQEEARVLQSLGSSSVTALPPETRLSSSHSVSTSTNMETTVHIWTGNWCSSSGSLRPGAVRSEHGIRYVKLPSSPARRLCCASWRTCVNIWRATACSARSRSARTTTTTATHASTTKPSQSRRPTPRTVCPTTTTPPRTRPRRPLHSHSVRLQSHEEGAAILPGHTHTPPPLRRQRAQQQVQIT
ncbi:hypothetical protein INR49_004758 [Caranx melampygus]|nr:hypothetical protein INR49_004758 [Caranx melampygus]